MIEQTILSNLIYNDDFSRKVTPYLKEEYFDEISTRKIFSSFVEYVAEYKEPPSLEALKITISQRTDLNEESFKQITETIDKIKIDKDTNQEWLIEQTEKFCQDKDLFLSIRKAIQILDGKDPQHDKGAIPKLLSDSLGVSFDSHIGHDYLEDYEDRYEFYHRKEERLPFDVDILNKITKGGLPKKSLTVFLASTGAGKSLVMCHMAAASLMFGKNVLYITAELAEERVAERIDANLLNVTLDTLIDMPKDVFEKKIKRVKEKTTGKLVIKEYATSSAHSGHFRHLLNEMRLKKGFVPDIIFIDYLNICASSRIKGANAANTYVLVKSIAEEIRGLAMEFNVPIVSATQANRCLSLDTIVEKSDGTKIQIKDISLGDKILSSDGKFVTVNHVYPIEKQKTYLIKTKSGKTIKASSKHIFPSAEGLVSIESGLRVGSKLFSKSTK